MTTTTTTMFEIQPEPVVSGFRSPSWGIYYAGGRTPIMVCRSMAEAMRERKKLEAREAKNSPEAKAAAIAAETVKMLEAKLRAMRLSIESIGLTTAGRDRINAIAEILKD